MPPSFGELKYAINILTACFAMYVIGFPLFASLGPAIILVVYHTFKNPNSVPGDVEAFFENFRVGGHRGSPVMRPENSMEGFKQAKKEGVDLIEFDVALTKDKIAVILHDDTLDRTSNMKGNIRDYNLVDLGKINVAEKHDWRAGESVFKTSIPTLAEVVAYAKTEHLKLLFDVKDTDEELVDQLIKLFQTEELYGMGIVCSFFPHVIYRIKKADPKILIGLTWRRYFFSHSDIESVKPRFSGPLHYGSMLLDVINVWALKTFLPSFLGADMLLTERSEISQSFVQDQKVYGRKVCAWTVNDLNEMRWMQSTLLIPVLTDKPFLIDDLGQ
uniref:GP-PDE domain-containing protein n=1 Tax=Rhabditophanes sp. KR3021 TaxID=114890 RepID=A0AC35TFP6_9BILA